MQTYCDYRDDLGLGFGFSVDDEDKPNIRRASDVGGSEIVFECDDETAEAILDEIGSDAQCGLESDGPDGSDEGLTEFWRWVERCIRLSGSKIIKS